MPPTRIKKSDYENQRPQHHPRKVTSLKKGPVSSSITLEIAPGIEIVSSITSESAAGLKLKKGQKAYAIIKASSVIIGAD